MPCYQGSLPPQPSSHAHPSIFHLCLSLGFTLILHVAGDNMTSKSPKSTPSHLVAMEATSYLHIRRQQSPVWVMDPIFAPITVVRKAAYNDCPGLGYTLNPITRAAERITRIEELEKLSRQTKANCYHSLTSPAPGCQLKPKLYIVWVLSNSYGPWRLCLP